MTRLDAIRTAERPKMHGRAMLSGPSGAGKTWTSLSMARVLAEGDMTRVLVIDTEHESALTYADVYTGFNHLPWRPPFDPTELTETYASLGDRYLVVITDSFSHFWRGQGGTLDIADGKIGGWKSARPVQDALVQAVLSVPAHMLLCVRSKMDYLIENGGHSVTKLGMAPIQDDTLVYEVNIALDIDIEHRITVTKSRTPAVPVGRMYPAGLEGKAAQDYADWLAGGVPPANRDDVDAIVARFADISNAEIRKAVKAEFVQLFGMPHSLTAEKMDDARRWLDTALAASNGEDEAGTGAGEPSDPPAAAPPSTDGLDASAVIDAKQQRGLHIDMGNVAKALGHLNSKGNGDSKWADVVLDALALNVTGGRTSSTKELTVGEYGRLVPWLKDVEEGRVKVVVHDFDAVDLIQGGELLSFKRDGEGQLRLVGKVTQPEGASA